MFSIAATDFAFLGLNDEATEGRLVWDDGSTFNPSYSHFINSNEEPRDCVKVDGNRWWWYASCSNGCRYVYCEYSTGTFDLFFDNFDSHL